MKSTLFWREVRFASQSEIACAMALSRYVRGWKPIEGETFQIPIGHGKQCDFMIKGVLVEYHPIAIPREMHRESYELFKKALARVSKPKRKQVRQAVKEHLFREYTHKRLWTIRLSKQTHIRDAELIVCKNPQDFYRKVIKEFADRPIPREWKFLSMFNMRKF